jgi:bacteriocin-like protein
MALPVRHFFGGKGIVSLILLEKQEKEKTKGKKESLSENTLSQIEGGCFSTIGKKLKKRAYFAK